MFATIVPFSKSPTVTLNSIFVLSPAGTSSLIPSAKFVSVNSSCASSFIVMLPSTNVVPSGILSFTSTSAGAVPFVLSKFIVYVISSPSFTVSPSSALATLFASKSAFFISVSVSFVGSSGLSGSSGFLFIVAVFTIVPSNVSPSSSSTVTSKLSSTFPAVSSFSLAGTSSLIPSAKFVSVNPSCTSLFIFMLPSTNVVPSGIVSFTNTSPAKSPVFSATILYVIVSFSTT